METNTAARTLAQLFSAQQQLDAEITAAVAAARAAGTSWAQIGAQLAVSKQAAQQRYGKTPAKGQEVAGQSSITVDPAPAIAAPATAPTLDPITDFYQCPRCAWTLTTPAAEWRHAAQVIDQHEVIHETETKVEEIMTSPKFEPTVQPGGIVERLHFSHDLFTTELWHTCPYCQKQDHGMNFFFYEHCSVTVKDNERAGGAKVKRQRGKRK